MRLGHRVVVERLAEHPIPATPAPTTTLEARISRQSEQAVRVDHGAVVELDQSGRAGRVPTLAAGSSRVKR